MSDQGLVAIVEDDDSARAAMARLVRALGYVPVEFESGNDFLRSGDASRTAFLIADVQMPGMTGLELHEHLAAAGWAIPTVLVTAYPEEATRRQALRAGVLRFLTKPFEPEDLLDVIRSSLTRRDHDPNH